VQDIQKKVENKEVEAIEKPPSNESEGPVQEEEKPENAPSTDENSSHLGDVDDIGAVVAAAKWVQKVHKISTLDSLWYERLGETYLILSEFDSAVEALTQATKLENMHWTCFRSLALALAGRDNESDLTLAVAEMEKVLDILRKMQEVQENKEDTTSKLIESLKQMAGWQNRLENVDKAHACYEEILLADPDDLEANYQVLKTTLRIGHEEPLQATLETLSKRKPKESELSMLATLITFLTTVEDRNTIFETLFLATQKSPLFDVLLENLEDALGLARKETRLYDLAVLLLQTGIALYHFDQREQKTPESALRLWAECGSLSSGNSSWGFQSVCRRAYRLTSFHYYHRAKASKDPSPHVEMLKQVVTRHQIIDQYAKSYLGCYYASIGDNDAAKRLFLDNFMSALALLSDEYEWNDYQGYLNLADTLMHSGDYLNALSAWSLIIPGDIDQAVMLLDEWKDEPMRSIANNLRPLIPNEAQIGSVQRQTFSRLIEEVDHQISQLEAMSEPDNTQLDAFRLARTLLNRPEAPDGAPRGGNLALFCDGECGLSWGYADDFYACKSCPDVQFCKDCRDKLVAGKLPVFICSSEHDWLHIPKWDDEEYAKVGRSKVKIGGTWDGEARVGGEVVTIEAWLDLLRDAWGVPRVRTNENLTAAEIARV
jgi:tetratricopeptide (TPR) repeat protein